MKGTKAQLRAQRNYRLRHKNQVKVMNYRCTTRMFIKRYASNKDLLNIIKDAKAKLDK